MGRVERLACFQLQKYHSIHHKISIVGTDGLIVKANWNWDLPLKGNSMFSKSNGHRFFVNLFKKPKPEFVVDLVRNADDLFGQF